MADIDKAHEHSKTYSKTFSILWTDTDEYTG